MTQGSQLNFEQLEARNLLATLVVNSTADLPVDLTDNVITLRDAIEAANTDALVAPGGVTGFGADTITFDDAVFDGVSNNGLIRLTQGALEITDSLTIDASLATDVTITGDANGDDVTVAGTFITDVDASFDGAGGSAGDLLDDNSRVLDFNTGSGDLTLRGLTVTGGRPIDSFGHGGGILFGRLSISGTLTLEQSTVSGNSNATGFFNGGGVYTPSGSVRLINSTVSGNVSSYQGGGIYNRSGSVGLYGSTVSGNESVSSGGGIYSRFGGVTLTNSSVSNNSTTGAFGDGGGIGSNSGEIRLNGSTISGNSTAGLTSSGGGVFAYAGGVTLDHSTVSGNINTGAGGGIYTRSGDVVALEQSEVSGNRTTKAGGGIFSNSGRVQLTNSTVSENESGVEGGGVSASFGAVTLTSSTVSGNESGSQGGGIQTSSGAVRLFRSTVSGNNSLGSNGGGISTSDGSVTLDQSTVSGNESFTDGGGVSTSSGEVWLTNSTVSGNESGARGGGIRTFSGTLTLYNSTISGNEAVGDGGGLFSVVSSDSFNLVRNSILAGNLENVTAPNVGDPNDLDPASNSTLIVSYSLIGVADSGLTMAQQTAITHVARNNLTGTLLAPLDPMLGPLANNGGPTETQSLLLGSPAIDAGDPNAAAGQGVDQRGIGFERVLGGRLDIGAIEFNPASVNDAPQVVNATIDEGGVLARPDLWKTLAVEFDQDVEINASALSMRNDTLGGTVVDLSSAIFDYSDTTFTAMWTFDGADPLPAAFHSYTLDASSITAGGFQLDGNGDGTAGDDLVTEHYVAIPGDANLDGVVDVLDDGVTLVENLNSTTNVAWADGNFNGDGVVDVLGDAAVLVGNLGRDVRPPTLLATSSSVSTATANLTLGSPNDAGEREEATDGTNLAAPLQSPSLALAGDHELRDDVFGSDF